MSATNGVTPATEADSLVAAKNGTPQRSYSQTDDETKRRDSYTSGAGAVHLPSHLDHRGAIARGVPLLCTVGLIISAAFLCFIVGLVTDHWEEGSNLNDDGQTAFAGLWQICFVTPLRVVNGTVIDAATDCFAISGDCLVTNRRNNTIQLPNCSNWKFSRGAAVTATVLTALSMACFVLILVMRRKPKTRRLYRALMLLLQFTAALCGAITVAVFDSVRELQSGYDLSYSFDLFIAGSVLILVAPLAYVIGNSLCESENAFAAHLAHDTHKKRLAASDEADPSHLHPHVVGVANVGALTYHTSVGIHEDYTPFEDAQEKRRLRAQRAFVSTAVTEDGTQTDRSPYIRENAGSGPNTPNASSSSRSKGKTAQDV